SGGGGAGGGSRFGGAGGAGFRAAGRAEFRAAGRLRSRIAADRNAGGAAGGTAGGILVLGEQANQLDHSKHDQRQKRQAEDRKNDPVAADLFLAPGAGGGPAATFGFAHFTGRITW